MLSGSIIDDLGEIKGVGLWLLDRLSPLLAACVSSSSIFGELPSTSARLTLLIFPHETVYHQS